MKRTLSLQFALNAAHPSWSVNLKLPDTVDDERVLTARARRHYIILPQDPNEEELARNWTLSEADKTEVMRCRGNANRCWIASSFVRFVNAGRFFDNYPAIPARILNHVSRQLNLPPILSLGPTDRNATETVHQQSVSGISTF